MTSDASHGNSQSPQPFWSHCAAGLHIGKMEPRPLDGEFGAVLTLAAQPGRCDDGIRHRHIPLSYMNLDPNAFADAIDFVYDQFAADRPVLIRSEGGLQRPGLVVAATLMRLGAQKWEAISCVRRNAPHALTDFRYLNVLSALAEVWE